MPRQGLDEPPSSNFHPIYNYISSGDFHPGGHEWKRLVSVQKATLDKVSPCPRLRMSAWLPLKRLDSTQASSWAAAAAFNRAWLCKL